MPLEPLTLRSYGTVGNSQAAATLVTSLTLLSAGRYKVWGNVRHTLVDGVRLVATGQANFIIANPAAASQDFGPIVMDLNTSANTILLELQTATGAADTASANLYAQKL